MAAGQKAWGYLNYQSSHTLEMKSKRILEFNSIKRKITLDVDMILILTKLKQRYPETLKAKKASH